MGPLVVRVEHGPLRPLPHSLLPHSLLPHSLVRPCPTLRLYINSE